MKLKFVEKKLMIKNILEILNPNVSKVGVLVAGVLEPGRDQVKARADQRSEEPLMMWF